MIGGRGWHTDPIRCIMRVRNIFPIGPAAESGGRLRPGDVILCVNGHVTKHLTNAVSRHSLQSTLVEDQQFLCLVQDNFLTQHVLEPTRATRVLDIVLSSQKELVDNVEIKEPLGSSDHNQICILT